MKFAEQVAFLDALDKLNMPRQARYVKDNFGAVMTWAWFKRCFPAQFDWPEWTLGFMQDGRFVSVAEMAAMLKSAPSAESGLFQIFAGTAVDYLRDLLFASTPVNTAIDAAVNGVLGKYRG